MSEDWGSVKISRKPPYGLCYRYRRELFARKLVIMYARYCWELEKMLKEILSGKA